MTIRLHPDRGWWAKFDRAQEHLDELQAAIAPYTVSRKYPVSSKIESKKRPREHVYRVNLNRAPNQDWCLIVGDFLFNLCCALDHLAVALNPPKRKNDLIYFPTYAEDPWRRKQGTRRYVESDPTNRKNFTDWTRDMLPVARTFLKQSQPYATAEAAGEDPFQHTLILLKQFHVTDKHRRLLAISHGANGGRLRYVHPKSGKTETEVYVAAPDRLMRDGAVVKRLPFKVNMEFTGSVSVAFARNVPRQTKLGFGPYLGLETLFRIEESVASRLLALEPHIQW